MQNTITHQQIVDHGKKLIQIKVSDARYAAQQYRTGKYSWLSTNSLIHGQSMAISSLAFTLGSIAPHTWPHELHIELDQAVEQAEAELDALQKELLKHMQSNIHTAA